jgi:membrane-bound lytic murein transglycosylase D
MRFTKLYVRTTVLASLILAASACQTAQKPAALLPPGKTPALKAAPVPATAAAQTQQPATAPQAEQPPQKPTEPEATSQTPPTLASDRVADLIAQVEKEYQAGLANHEAGRADEAKENFDNALNTLLGSDLDVRSDARLQKEFDRIVQGVNELYPGGPNSDADA